MTEHKVLPILMFCALPASGKSETRRYLKTLTAEDTKKFHLGETSTQVDDFPYVDGMKKIDAAAVKVLGHTISTRLILISLVITTGVLLFI